MTRTGDHGGDSKEETIAALFAYSPNDNFKQFGSENTNNPLCESGTVKQIDLVPTLSHLLGIPIPFSNIGSTITQLISQNEDESYLAVKANALQILNYLEHYNTNFPGVFPTNELKRITDTITEKLDSNNDLNQTEALLSALRGAEMMCRRVWAQFDVNLMFVAMTSLSTLCVLLLAGNMTSSTSLCIATGQIASCLLLGAGFPPEVIVCVTMALLAFSVYVSLRRIKISTFFVMTLIVYVTLNTSDSFVVNEDDATFYVYVTGLVIFTTQQYFSEEFQPLPARKPGSRPTRLQKLVSFSKSSLVMLLMMSLLAMATARSMKSYKVCRPEQFWCYDNDNEAPTNYRFLLQALCLIAITLGFRFLLKSSGNMRNDISAAKICCNHILPLVAILTFVYWQVDAASNEVVNSIPDHYLDSLPRVAFVLLFISAVWWFISPITAQLMFRDRRGNYRSQRAALSEVEVRSQLYEKLKSDYSSSTSEVTSNGTSAPSTGGEMPLAFGLFTLASAAYLGLLHIVVMLVLLLLGASNAASIAGFLLTSYLTLHFTSHKNGDGSVSWDMVAWWSVSSWFWFFTTGHQTSISTIPWNSAFVGFHGSHPTVWLPAVMVTTNVFASQILHTVSLPLLLLWPVARGQLFTSKKKFDGELEFLQSGSFWKCFDDIIMKYLTMSTVKTLGVLLAALIHRRHLMMWKIFAPRFLYQVLSYFVTCVTLVPTYFFMHRIQSCLGKWIDDANKHSSKL